MKKFFARAKAVLEGKGGEGYVDTAVKMIIAVVIGALLLGGLYFIFNSLILPGACRTYPRYDLVLPVEAEAMGGGGCITFSNSTTQANPNLKSKIKTKKE